MKSSALQICHKIHFTFASGIGGIPFFHSMSNKFASINSKTIDSDPILGSLNEFGVRIADSGKHYDFFHYDDVGVLGEAS